MVFGRDGRDAGPKLTVVLIDRHSNLNAEPNVEVEPTVKNKRSVITPQFLPHQTDAQSQITRKQSARCTIDEMHIACLVRFSKKR